MNTEKRMKKTFVWTLLFALLLSGCAKTGAEETSGTPAPTADETSQNTLSAETDTETETTYLDTMPVVDLGGLTINTLVREEAKNEFVAENSGDIMETVVYERNLAIEERFSCKLNYITIPGSWGFRNDFQNTIRGTVLGGDSSLDMVTGQSNIVQPLNAEGLFSNMLDEEYLDLTKPYWVHSYTDAINLKGEVGTLCGDFALSSFSNANVIFFNKAMMDKYNIAYPYEDALAGKWTLDSMISLSEQITSDVNGDGAYTLDDIRGFCAYSNSIQPFFSSTGQRYTEIDAEGNRIVPPPSEQTASIADKLNTFCHSNMFVHAVTEFPNENSLGLEPSMCKSFMDEKYLFMGMVLEQINALRDMQVDFGILPYPKYDEAQKEYYTTILRRYSVAAIPTTAASSSNSALILEALAAEGYSKIAPKYYEVALKHKYVRDESSTQVLDLIKNSLYLEFVDIYYSQLGFSDAFAIYVLNNNAGTYVSNIESNRTAWNNSLAQLYK